MIQTEQTQLISVELGVHDTHRASFEKMIANGELTLKGKSVNKDKHPMIHKALQGSPTIWIAAHVPKSRVDEDTRDILESRRFEHLSFSNNSRYGSYRFMIALKTLFKVLKMNSDKEWKCALLGTESYTQEDSHPIVVTTRDLEDQGHELYQMEDMESGKFLMNFTDLDGEWTRTFDHFEFCIEASELKFELHKEVRVYRAGHCNDSCITSLQTIGKCSCPNPNCAIVALKPCNSVSELFDKEIPAYFEDESLEVRIAFKDEKQNLIGIQDIEESDKIIVVKFDCMKEAFKILKKGQIIQLDDIYRLPLTDCSVKLMNEKLKTQRVSPFCIYRDDTMRVKVIDSSDVSDEVIELDREIKLDLNQDIWHRRNKGIIESIHSKETYVNEDTLGWNLNPAQEHALKQVLDGKNALILGEGGTGKSHLLKRSVAELRRLNKCIYVTASTGVAACLIEGRTIHSITGITNQCISSRPLWKEIQVLIIDEISMLGLEYFTKLENELREIRDPTKVFGGVQVVTFGDFLQLPPVKATALVGQVSKWFPEPILLTEQYRQQSVDEEQIKFLSKLRELRYNTELYEGRRLNKFVRELKLNTTTGCEPVGSSCTIVTTNSRADTINTHALKPLLAEKLEKIQYEARFTPCPGNCGWKDYSDMKKEIHDGKDLTLVVGARVILTKNITNRLVNGLLGEVTKFESIDLRSKRFGDLTQSKWQWEMIRNHFPHENNEVTLPYIRFDNGLEEMIPLVVGRETNDDYTVYGCWMPLKLAWAFTIHKCQGMTIDGNVCIHLDPLFEPALLYVALSRVRSKNQITLLNNGTFRFKHNSSVRFKSCIEFYRKLKIKADELETNTMEQSPVKKRPRKGTEDNSIIQSPDPPKKRQAGRGPKESTLAP